MSKVRDGNIVMQSSEQIKMNTAILSKPEIKNYSESHSSVSSAAGAVALDLVNGSVFSITLSENTTFAFSNPPDSGKAGAINLILTQNADVKTATWPAAVKWPGGTAADITTASAVYILTFLTVDAGTTWYGFVSGSEMATP